MPYKHLSTAIIRYQVSILLSIPLPVWNDNIITYTASHFVNCCRQYKHVNNSACLLAVFVTKDKQTNLYNENEKSITQIPKATKSVYRVTAVNIKSKAKNFIRSLSMNYENQIMVQFLYPKKPASVDRLLVLKHLESKLKKPSTFTTHQKFVGSKVPFFSLVGCSLYELKSQNEVSS